MYAGRKRKEVNLVEANKGPQSAEARLRLFKVELESVRWGERIN
jgi:hypothetical protein